MDEDKILLLAGHIAKMKHKVLISLNSKNEFVFANFYYEHKSSRRKLYDYSNKLIFRKESITLSYDSKDFELPSFLYNSFDIYSSGDKYLVQLVDYTYDEIVQALLIAKRKMDAVKAKKTQQSEEQKLIKSMKKYI